MPPLISSLMFPRTSNWLYLLVLIYFLLIAGLPVEAQAPTKNNLALIAYETELIAFADQIRGNPWSNIKGFRSAKFGMDEKSVYRAIAKDFKLAIGGLTKLVHPINKTDIMVIKVPNLLEIGGIAKVAYIFGYKSKKLSHINVLWGKGASQGVDAEVIVYISNLLRTHFLKKRYKEDSSLSINGKLSETSTIVFRGKDKIDKMILLVLNTTKPPKGGLTKNSLKEFSLLLSYVPKVPDVFTATD
jgi:hypothetical protein